MLILRLFTPSYISSSTAPSPTTPTLTLRVPAYGIMYLPRPRLEYEDDNNEPRTNVLKGELEVKIPPGTQRRCRSIKVGFQSFSKIDVRPGRGWEEDVIFERESEHRAGNSEGIWLEEGITKYKFTFNLPQTLAVHDWHVEGIIRLDLYAEIEGLDTVSSTYSIFNQ